jgi:hypothetical protein
VLELWQDEWCPASHRVRERLTELGADDIARQVPVEKQDRLELVRRTGSDAIPVLTLSTTVRPRQARTRYAATSTNASPSHPTPRHTE